MSMLAHRLHLRDRLARGRLRSAELLRVSVRRLVRGACGLRELLVAEVHRLVELQMQVVSLRDDLGELRVEVVDVRFRDAQVRLGERGACRARAGGRLALGALLRLRCSLPLRGVLLLRRRNRIAVLERIRVHLWLALGAVPVPRRRPVAHAPQVLVLPRPRRVHEARDHAHLAVLGLAAVELRDILVDMTARGVFAHPAVQRVPRSCVCCLLLRLGLRDVLVGVAVRLARVLRARLLAVLGLALLLRLVSQALVAHLDLVLEPVRLLRVLDRALHVGVECGTRVLRRPDRELGVQDRLSLVLVGRRGLRDPR